VSLPPPASRPAGDPFQEPAEPRLPRGLPEEKLEYFRNVLKQKQETLARARELYAEREQEADQLREAARALQAQVEATFVELDRLKDFPSRLQEMEQQFEWARTRTAQAESRAEQAEARAAGLDTDFQAVVEDRKSLSKALAEVEVQVPELTAKVEEERKARAAVAEELIELKEALKIAEEQVGELTANKSEAEGDLAAVTEQYQTVSSENERLSSELDRTSEELKTVAAERDAAIAERIEARDDVEALNARIQDLEQQVTAAGARAHEQARRSVQEAQEQARRSIHEAHEHSRRSLQEAESRANDASEQVEQLKVLASRLQAEKANAKAQAEQHLKKLKDELTASTQRKIGELQTALMGEEEKRAELEGRLVDAEGKAEALARQVASLEGQLGSARSDQAGSRKVRDELAGSQQRAAELQGLLQKERRERDGVEKRAAAAEGSKKELEARIDALEAALARVKSEPDRSRAVSGSGSAPIELVAERDKLKSDVASMKKKLVAAESAMETAALLRAKVARLEAQLKGKK
jgi:chromosome segregation ATPase